MPRPFPQVTAEIERAGVTPAAARRLADLLTAAWVIFDGIAAVSPAELCKSPRGGGRDRDELVDHVIGAEAAFARKVGVRLKRPAADEIAAIENLRHAIAAVVGAPSDGSPVVPNGWTTRYGICHRAGPGRHTWEGAAAIPPAGPGGHSQRRRRGT
jgi:hypothetical protein